VRFRRWVVFTFLVHVGIVVVERGGGLIIYKLLEDDPATKGVVDMLGTLPFVLMAVANLGLATSLVYHLRRREFGYAEVAGTVSAVAWGWGTLVAGIGIVASQIVGPAVKPEWNFDLRYVVPICLCVPFLLGASYLNSIQLCQDRLRDYNLVQIAGSIPFLPLFFLLWWITSGAAALSTSVGRLLTAIGACAVAWWLSRRMVDFRPRFERRVFGALVRFGWRANLTSVLTYLNHRLDLYLVGALFAAGALGAKRQFEEAAFYSLAVSFAQLVWHFPEAMRDLFFSRVAGESEAEALRLTPLLCRLLLITALLGGIAIWLLVDPFMTLFSPTSWDAIWRERVLGALRWLLPGTVAFTVVKILQNHLAARGQLGHCIVAGLLVLVLIVSLDVLWVPEQGALGAARASTIAYLASAAYTMVVYRLTGGAPILHCLVPRAGDFRYVREIGAAVRDKLRRRRP
jgi:O-antigen/teichoic acid export membrane protein